MNNFKKYLFPVAVALSVAVGSVGVFKAARSGNMEPTRSAESGSKLKKDGLRKDGLRKDGLGFDSI